MIRSLVARLEHSRRPAQPTRGREAGGTEAAGPAGTRRSWAARRSRASRLRSSRIVRPNRRRARSGWTSGTRERSLSPSGRWPAERACGVATVHRPHLAQERSAAARRVRHDGVLGVPEAEARCDCSADEVVVALIRLRVVEDAHRLEDGSPDEEVGCCRGSAANRALLVEEGVHVQEVPDASSRRNRQPDLPGGEVGIDQRGNSFLEPVRVGLTVRIAESDERPPSRTRYLDCERRTNSGAVP